MTHQPVKTYPTEESAQRRAEQLQALGIWPGVVRCGAGSGGG